MSIKQLNARKLDEATQRRQSGDGCLSEQVVGSLSLHKAGRDWILCQQLTTGSAENLN